MTPLPATGYAALRRYRDFDVHLYRDCGRLRRSHPTLIYRSRALRVCRTCLLRQEREQP